MSDTPGPPQQDESSFFTLDEIRRALSFLDGDAGGGFDEIASHNISEPPEAWEFSPDFLDLLALVSEDCAARVARIRGLRMEEAAEIRKAASIRFGIPI